jgi:hypothetical protein
MGLSLFNITVVKERHIMRKLEKIDLVVLVILGIMCIITLISAWRTFQFSQEVADPILNHFRLLMSAIWTLSTVTLVSAFINWVK